MSDTSLSAETLASLRLAHLNMLLGVINRLAGSSATVKNFCISLATALGGIAVAQDFPDILWAAVAAVVLFSVLDAYYLALERAFRNTYTAVQCRPLSAAADLSIARGPANVIAALGSPSIWLFYLPQLGLVLAVATLR